MQGSINFDGSLIGNITGGGGGGGSEVVITPVLTSGTKIADVTVDGEDKDLFAPTPTPPTPATEVSVTQTLASGTKIGSIEVDGESTDLYAPTPTPPTPATEVSVTQVLTEGTKIASIEVDGDSTDIYAPYQSAANTSYDNTISELTADDVQEAIDEISGITGDGQLDIGDDLTDGVNQLKQSLSDLTIIEKTASGAVVTFDDGSDLPIPYLKVSIEPVQSGSGNPSPDNIRPISGWSNCIVTVADDLDDPNVQNIYTIALGASRYGGTLDVNNGILTVDREFDTYSALDSQYGGVGPDIVCAFITVNDMKANSRENGMSNYFNPTATIINQNNPWKVSFGINNKRIFFTFDPVVIDGDTIEDINNYVATNPIQVVYPLATPLTIQLTPTQVKSLLGVNNIWADTGDLELKYFVNKPLTYTIYDMINILTS